MRRGISLQTKLILAIVCLFVLFLWALVLHSAAVLRNEFSVTVAAEQHASTRRLAGELDSKLTERVRTLVDTARAVPQQLVPGILDSFLQNEKAARMMFPTGLAVIGLDGRTIADLPVAPGRRGMYFGDRGYFTQAIATKHAYVDKPIMGRALQRPLITMGAPVLDAQGKVRAVLTGLVDLTAPNFLGVIANPTMSGKGAFYVVSLRDRVVVAATDKSSPLLPLSPLPPRGRNPLFDPFLDGYQGSLTLTAADGRRTLVSGARVPAGQWVVVAALPVDDALAPVDLMRDRLFATAALASLLAAIVISWLTRNLLAPLGAAAKAMRAMTRGSAPLAPLPVRHNDEVGQLIGQFNLLVEERRRYEAALELSEQRFRTLVEAAPDAIMVVVDERLAYVNPAALRLFGASERAQLAQQPLLSRIHPGCRAAAQRCLANAQQQRTEAVDMQLLRLDASVADVEVSAAPFRYEEQDASLLFVRETGERVRVNAVLRQSEQRLHAITANTPGMVFQCQMRPSDDGPLFTYVSEGSLPLVGVEPADLLGSRGAIAKRIAPPDRAAFAASLKHSAATMQVWNWQGRLGVGQAEQWLECRATPRAGEDGAVIWEGVMFNITASKHAADKVRQSRQLLRELSAHMETVREEERKRIAREIHDELGQAMTALRMDVSLLRLHFGSTSTQLMERIHGMTEVVDRTIHVVRNITSSLRPVALDLGLLPALEWQAEEFARHTGLACKLTDGGLDDIVLDEPIATAMFRIVQESLTNVAKHAQATRVEILIVPKENAILCIQVRDNGVGFMPEAVRKRASFGLVGMQERALMLGCTLEIRSAPGAGTCVEVGILRQ